MPSLHSELPSNTERDADTLDLDFVTTSYFKAFIALSLVCLLTRLTTGLRSSLKPSHIVGLKSVSVLPYWIPWLGHLLPFTLQFQDFLVDARKSTKDAIFGIIIGGTQHNVILSASIAKYVLNHHTALSVEPTKAYVMERFFGYRGGIDLVDREHVLTTVHEPLLQLMHEPVLSEVVAAAVQGIEEKTPSLVGFNRSWVDQSFWERSANVEIGPDGATAEVSLFPLLRNFVGELASEVLMGKEFIANNPNVLADLWEWDYKFGSFMLGVPSWFPTMNRAYRARERVLKAVEDHHNALCSTMDGKDPGSQWGDMSDVSKVMVDRAKVWRSASAPARAYATGGAMVLWAMNINANQVVFWLLWHVYQSHDLLADLRQEISPYVKIKQVNTGLPIAPPSRLSIDMDGLTKGCLLLKSTLYETMRLNVLSASYRYILEDLTVAESVKDAMIQGHSEPQRYKMFKGQFVCVPHGVHQRDERYFTDPDKFEPTRFFVTDERTKKVTADMGTMKVFGAGTSVCKGRVFAEQEVIAFCASIISFWDMEAVGGKWAFPGHIVGSGAARPLHDVRVRLSKRDVE